MIFLGRVALYVGDFFFSLIICVLYRLKDRTITAMIFMRHFILIPSDVFRSDGGFGAWCFRCRAGAPGLKCKA